MGRLLTAGALTGRTEIDVAVGSQRTTFREWTPGDDPFAETFAFDSETTRIRDDLPERVPDYVLGVASDGDRGVFVSRKNLPAFWAAHAHCAWAFHHAAFDLAVVQKALGVRGDVYALVEDGRAWDTLILAKQLGLATRGTTGGAFSLDACAAEFLRVDLPKTVTDAAGNDVRTGFGRFLNKPVAAIPPDYLRYAAGDAVATWLLFGVLKARIRAVRKDRRETFGETGDDRLAAAWREYGPLTHHTQLKSTVMCDVMRRTGLGVDADRAAAARDELGDRIDQIRAELAGATFGDPPVPFVVEGPGSGASLQALLSDVHARRPDLPKPKTDSGAWAADESALTALADEEPVLATLLELKRLVKLRNTYFVPLSTSGGQVHAQFRPLLNTGRMSCSKPNLQNLPRAADGLPSVRACLVPKPGHVLLAVDYAQIELCVLAAVLQDQLRLGGSLAALVDDPDVDLHKRIAATVLNKTDGEVEPHERQSAKAVSFGRPGGMGAASLQRQAKEAYGVDLTDEEVQARIDAYEALVPELKRYLTDAADVGQRLAARLNLTPAAYAASKGDYDNDDGPAGWLGGMLLKVLRVPKPVTRSGRPYAPEELSYLWDAAFSLAGDLGAERTQQMRTRKSSKKLASSVERLVGRNACTLTGRFRSNCLFTESRNTLFQGVAADGLILALWDLWRAGYRPVLAIHDEIVLEVAEKDLTKALVDDVTARMEAAMGRVIPGVKVTAEPTALRSLDKANEAELPRE
ncbi:DNA polymerase [Alienimonas californiensis]|uniref:DNA-directed DNA polymerase n=1 Tax=Alienimonas californiensis TaxID=2527989 RepID=A0A517PB69_9PLAN|nr:DNA polymerase [Alienimonas californiensis]QDT16610.1 DNA polymerase I [Alienimonas californiensis]